MNQLLKSTYYFLQEGQISGMRLMPKYFWCQFKQGFSRNCPFRAAEDLDEIETRALDAQVWSEAAPRPRLTSSATPYRDHLNTLRLRSLRLEEKRLLEIRRLQVSYTRVTALEWRFMIRAILNTHY